ncbi:MAG: hypothetical protein H6981_11850 [Gammaproteobacteria bacterium]|nr:hypothetical protein [Gammaproteobacteria bacterium]MCP5137481.1 hypothetical protein [Gammaproteobacteria bacterium]
MSASAIVVVGATGLLGEALIELLAERDGLGVEVVALASARSVGKRVEFGERRLKVLDLHDYTFRSSELVLLCVPAKVVAKALPRIQAAGARVIDFSGHLADLPPALPWVANGAVDAAASAFRAAATVNAHVACSLVPLHTLAGIEDVRVNVLQAVSARGRGGISELAGQAARLLNVQAFEPKLFPAQIAFNALPDDNDFAAWTSDLAVLLGIDATSVSLSRAWVSVFHGQTVHVDVLTRKALAAETLIDTWREIPQLEFNSEATLSPVVDGSRGDIIQLGGLRVRARPGGGSRVSYWSVADDVRHATAANGIAISEILIKPDQ